jgi:apolipoprotein N-acyltransferase
MRLSKAPATVNSAVVMSSVAGMLVALAMPPFPFGFLAWVGIALWLWALDGPLPPFRSGLLFGIGYAAPALFWIGWVTIPGTAALILITAAEYGLLAAAYMRLNEKYGRGLALAAFPLMWILLEKLRATGFIGFPWLNLAHTQLDYLWLYQFVEYTGDCGLSFWVACMGVLIFAFQVSRKGSRLILAALWVALPVSWGAWRVNHLPAVPAEIRVGIIQGDIDTYRKWDDAYVDTSYLVYETLTREVAGDVDLIIWPETAAPTYLKQDASRRIWAQNLAREVQAPMLIGTLSYERLPGADYIYNSAYEVFPDERWEGPYSKQQLVPFGEMIPGAQWFPFLERIDLGQGNFRPGPGPVVFDSTRHPHSVLICYESAFSELAREQVLRGARFLVIITNDSWYGRTPGPAQHAAMASLRAAEFRMGVARAANGGISLWTDSAGRRHGATKLFTRGVVKGTVPLSGGLTFYASHGQWFVWLCGIPGALLFLAAWVRPIRL